MWGLSCSVILSGEHKAVCASKRLREWRCASTAFPDHRRWLYQKTQSQQAAGIAETETCIAGIPNYNHRFISPDKRCKSKAIHLPQRWSIGNRIQGVYQKENYGVRQMAGRNRTGRAGSRRIWTKRYGGVFWRSIRRLSVHRKSMGTVLWYAMRKTTHYMGGCLSWKNHYHWVVCLCTVLDEKSNEGNADWPCNNPQLVMSTRGYFYQGIHFPNCPSDSWWGIGFGEERN